MNKQIAAFALITVTLAACSDAGPAGPATGQSEALAISAMGSGFMMVGPPIGPLEMPCPAGGKRILSGEHNVSTANGVSTSTFKHTLTYVDCATQLPHGKVVMKGSTQSEGTSRIQEPAALGGRPTLLELNSHDVGTITSTFADQSHSCSIDLRHTLERATNTMRVKGTACGNAIDRSFPLLRP